MERGLSQFAPFAATVIAIVLTDLLMGVMIGMAVSIGFILRSNMRRPLRRIVEKHLGGEVVHIELANQVSFLNRGVLARTLDEVPPGGHVLLDAQNTDYIDPDVLDMIRDFKEQTGPARGVRGEHGWGSSSEYQLQDRTQYVDYSSRELQSSLTPQKVLQILKDGHERFRSGRRLTRDLGRLADATASGQHPLAVVLSCIDSRTPAELIFDLGLGDILSVRIAGSITSRKVLGSLEYGCAVAGARLIVVMGHTRCGAVTAAVDHMGLDDLDGHVAGCEHLGYILQEIQKSIDPRERRGAREHARRRKGGVHQRPGAPQRGGDDRVDPRPEPDARRTGPRRPDRDRRHDVRRGHEKHRLDGRLRIEPQTSTSLHERAGLSPAVMEARSRLGASRGL